ncbi:hypothetical protein R9C00_17505 [Flammeovirgaceae bacterium SG7u.111]|nr:hypothetical protein [Flammeovirgaceae bacterium SG7u.132]WPO33500.1 hypothetical protein R9C00_17505 [Flammeovirgaceae bacterium SG7u.111]
MDKSIGEKLSEILNFINDTLDLPTELEIAIGAGFTKKQFEEAKKLYYTTVELKQLETVAEGRRMSATAAHKATKIAVKKHYARVIAIAKKLFKDDLAIVKQLELKGTRKAKYGEMCLQVFNFYSALLGNQALLDQLATASITKEYVQKGMKLYSEMEELKTAQRRNEKERAAAQDDFDAKIQQLDIWYTNTNSMINTWKKLNISPVVK